jgi:hypothetical protein
MPRSTRACQAQEPMSPPYFRNCENVRATGGREDGEGDGGPSSRQAAQDDETPPDPGLSHSPHFRIFAIAKM